MPPVKHNETVARRDSLRNEELYIVLKGSGIFYMDGDEFPIQEGSLIRVALPFPHISVIYF